MFLTISWAIYSLPISRKYVELISCLKRHIHYLIGKHFAILYLRLLTDSQGNRVMFYISAMLVVGQCSAVVSVSDR